MSDSSDAAPALFPSPRRLRGALCCGHVESRLFMYVHTFTVGGQLIIIISERYKKFEHTLALASAAKFSVNLAQSLSEQVRGNPPQEFTGKLKWRPVN